MRRVCLTALVAAAVWPAAACASRALRPDPKILSAAPPELLARVRADPYNYFRLINHEWTARVCDMFARELADQPVVQLHGDAHVEQYALTDDAWGLDDFDDSARGPALVDIVRFVGSIDLAARRRGWTRDRDLLVDRFFDGYRRGLSDRFYVPPEPDIVRSLRSHTSPPTREAFLAWAETKMSPMPDLQSKVVIAAMRVFADVVRQEQPGLPDGYFEIERAGWLQMGVGSALSTKILMRVRGRSADPADDDVLEAKAIRGLQGLSCLEVPASRPSIRVIVGSQQLGRLKHRILAAAPEVDIPEMTIQGKHLSSWWIRSWEPSYREITLDDLRSVRDLSEIVFDSGVQLGAGSIHGATSTDDAALRARSLASTIALQLRLRRAAHTLVDDLLKAWRELGGH